MLWSGYLALNGAIVAGAVAMLVIEKFAPRLSAKSLLSLHYGVATSVAISIVLQTPLPPGLLPRALLSIDLQALAAGGGDIAGGSPPR